MKTTNKYLRALIIGAWLPVVVYYQSRTACAIAGTITITIVAVRVLDALFKGGVNQRSQRKEL